MNSEPSAYLDGEEASGRGFDMIERSKTGDTDPASDRMYPRLA